MRLGTQLQRRIDAGWWWTYTAKPLVAGCALVALYVFATRQYAWPSVTVWYVVFAVPVISAAIGWVRSRPHRISLGASLSRLDIAHGLHHRLVAAHAGQGRWPDPPAAARISTLLPVEWNLRGVLTPPLLALLMLGSAAWLPVKAMETEPPVVRHAPRDWERIETIVDLLREQEVVREEALRQVEEQVAALRRKPSEEWYRQGSLEATDHLRDNVDRNVRELQRSLEHAAAMVETAAARRDQLTRDELNRMQENLGDLLSTLEQGALTLNEDLLARLKDIDLSAIREISLAELREIEEQLNKACEASGQCVVLLGGVGEGGGQGAPMDTPDGVETPLTLAGQESQLEQAVPQAVSNPDLQRAALGEMLALGDGVHEVDDAAYQGAVAAGTAADAGGAGEVVWRQSVIPSEQVVLREYFK